MIGSSDTVGGLGKREKFSGGPVYEFVDSDCLSRSMLAIDRSVFANDLDIEWDCIGRGDSDPAANDGVVSDRFRVSATALGVLLDVRNCAADADDLSILGVVEPLNTVNISSPLADRSAVAY